MIYFDIFMALLKASLAMGCLWGTLRLLDLAAGTSFKHDLLPKIKDGNMAVSFYCAVRFLGACVLYGILFFIPI